MKLESDIVFDQWLKDLRDSEDVDASIVIIRNEIRVYDDALDDEIRVESCIDRDDEKIQTLCLRAARLSHLLKVLEWRVEQRNRDYQKQKPLPVSKSPRAVIVSDSMFEQMADRWRLEKNSEAIAGSIDYYESERARLAPLESKDGWGEVTKDIEVLDYRIKCLIDLLSSFGKGKGAGRHEKAFAELKEQTEQCKEKIEDIGEVIEDATFTVLKGDMEALADASHLLGDVVSNMRVITVAEGKGYARKDMRLSDLDGAHLMTAFALVERVIKHSGLKR